MSIPATELATLGAGFASPVLDSQRVFRAALDAMSRPGRIVTIDAPWDRPEHLHAGAGAIALALLDQDTPLWLSPRLAGAASYLRFHTGCPVTFDPGGAEFALIDCAELGRLDLFRCGSEEYPDRSATLVVQVESLEEDRGLSFSGPGIRGRSRLSVGGLGEAFLLHWTRNLALFPRGVDAFLVCGERVCGLPRTTKIEA